MEAILKNITEPDAVEKLVEHFAAALTSAAPQQAEADIVALSQSAISQPTVVEFTVKLLERLAAIENDTVRMQAIVVFTKIASFFGQTKKNFEVYKEQFLNDCKRLKKYADRARFLEVFKPNGDVADDNEMLDFYTKIASDYLRGGDVSSAKKNLSISGHHRFVARSKKDLLRRYSIIDAGIKMRDNDFENASLDYLQVAESLSGPKKSKILRRAVVAAVLMDPGQSRDQIFGEINGIPEVHELPVYKIFIRLNQSQIVSPAEIDEMWDELNQEGYLNKETVLRSIKKHNLGEISKMYSAISMDRITTMTGAAEDEILLYIRGLVRENKMKVGVDQLHRMIYFEPMETESAIYDASIAAYTREIQEVVGIINEY